MTLFNTTGPMSKLCRWELLAPTHSIASQWVNSRPEKKLSWTKTCSLRMASRWKPGGRASNKSVWSLQSFATYFVEKFEEFIPMIHWIIGQNVAELFSYILALVLGCRTQRSKRSSKPAKSWTLMLLKFPIVWPDFPCTITTITSRR